MGFLDMLGAIIDGILSIFGVVDQASSVPPKPKAPPVPIYQQSITSQINRINNDLKNDQDHINNLTTRQLDQLQNGLAQAKSQRAIGKLQTQIADCKQVIANEEQLAEIRTQRLELLRQVTPGSKLSLEVQMKNTRLQRESCKLHQKELELKQAIATYHGGGSLKPWEQNAFDDAFKTNTAAMQRFDKQQGEEDRFNKFLNNSNPSSGAQPKQPINKSSGVRQYDQVQKSTEKTRQPSSQPSSQPKP